MLPTGQFRDLPIVRGTFPLHSNGKVLLAGIRPVGGVELVGDQALARELAGGLGEGDVARREDHVGLD